jgi:PAS domain S-box-containing protein
VARQRALEEMLSALGGRDDELLVVTDMEGRIRWANRARELYRGVPNAKIVGRLVGDLGGSEAMSPDALAAIARARRGEVVRDTHEVDYPGRGRRTMAATVQPARDEDGHQVGVLSSARDITELEAQRRALAERAEALHAANTSLEPFVRIASHDLREPLNTVVQFVGLARERSFAALDADGRLYFEQVEAGAQRMKRMLDDVLAFVRLEEAPGELTPAVDLDLVLAEVRAALGAQIAATGGTIESAPLGQVPGHATLLSLLLQNLLSNALKFTAPGVAPRVEVRALRADGELRLTVADHGIGIDAQRVPELGQPFRRLNARRRYDGTGLGLAICQRIAQHHRGRLEISSRLGSGSEFTLVLPLAA